MTLKIEDIATIHNIKIRSPLSGVQFWYKILLLIFILHMLVAGFQDQCF